MAKFNQETLDEIKKDPALFVAVANEMGIDPGSLPMALKRNGPSLNQYSIVTLVATHLGKEPEDLLEKDTEDINEQVSKDS